jgi:hypothetical protein
MSHFGIVSDQASNLLILMQIVAVNHENVLCLRKQVQRATDGNVSPLG